MVREAESPRPRMARCHARKRPLGATSPGVEVKMHPGMLAWWHARRHGAWGDGGCGPESPESVFAQGHPGGGPWGWHGGGGGHGGGDESGAGFGVRRPLRFLAFKLDLDDAQ